ncbi:MAG TPA: rhomboid family intramembrane serine protease [Candidatus Nanoarchaeia archaeon]|nr:rhomboid family intramembrane serine protease [Candidatus Nanoarchaeia archaeon]
MLRAVFILAGICIIAFIMQQTVPGFTDMFVLVSAEVAQRPWTLVTAVFLHGDIVHLLYNMFALVLFGMILEQIIGKKKFLAIFFLSGLFASIGTLFLYRAALGASGAIFGILGTLAMIRPRMQVWVSYIPMPMIVACAVWAITDLVGLFVPSGTANLAHLVGLFFGIDVGLYLRKNFGERADGRELYHVDEKEIDDWEKKWMK